MKIISIQRNLRTLLKETISSLQDMNIITSTGHTSYRNDVKKCRESAEKALHMDALKFHALMKQYIEDCPDDEVTQEIIDLITGIDISEFEKCDMFIPPLDYALKKKKWTLCDWLIENGCNPNGSLISAASDGRFDSIQYLITKGGDIEQYKDIMFTSAAFNSRFEIACYLLEQGADINHKAILKVYDNSIKEGFRFEHDDTVLLRAEKWGKSDVVKWLLEHGADRQS